MTNAVQPTVAQASVPVTAKNSTAKVGDAGAEKPQEREFSSYLQSEQDAGAASDASQTEPSETSESGDTETETGNLDQKTPDSESIVDVSDPALPAEGEFPDVVTLPDDGVLSESLEAEVQTVPAQNLSGPVEQGKQPEGQNRERPPIVSNESAAQQNIGTSYRPDSNEGNLLLRNSAVSGEKTVTTGHVSPHISKGHAAPVKNVGEMAAMSQTSQATLETGSPNDLRKPAEIVSPTSTPTEYLPRRDTGPITAPLQNQGSLSITKDGNRHTVGRSAQTDTIAPTSDPNGTPQKASTSGLYQVALSQGANLSAPTKNPATSLDLRGQGTSSFVDVGDYEFSGRLELQSTSRSPATSVSTVPDLPRHVAQQLSTAMSISGGKTTEVSLRPAELGRVSISLSSADSGLVVTILADRPETLDLLRRGAMQLATEFTDIGYGSVEFSFGQRASDQSKSNENEKREGPVAAIPAASDENENRPVVAPSSPVVRPDRVDVRI
ncbi:MAG: flagellar hook-length control protein FliK [Pseudomonadota bacterium]